MRRIFGTKEAKAPPPSLTDATSNLATRGESIDQKIAKLDEQLRKIKEQISKTRGPAQQSYKNRAVQILKQKRLYEGQRDQLYQQQFNIDQVAFTAESMKDTVTTVQALKATQKDIKQQMKRKEFDIDKIEALQDDMADMMDMQNDIQEALGRTYDMPDEIDESELMDELNALEDDMAFEATTAEAGATPSYLQEMELPSAPAGDTSVPNPQAETVDEFGLPIAQRN